MPDQDAPLTVQRFSFASRNEDETTEFLRQMYVGNRCTFTTPRDGRARFAARASAVADISSTQFGSSIDYRLSTEPTDSIFFLSVRRGRLGIRYEDIDASVSDGDTALYPSGIELDIVTEGMIAHVVKVPAALLDRVAAETMGLAPGELDFQGITPVSAAMGGYFRSVMALLGGAMEADESPMSSPLLAEEMIRTAAVAALHVFPNTTMTRQHVPGPGRAGPAALRRAVAYVDANAERPVTLSDVAAAAGTGTRAVQYAFRRHYGMTPLGYARRVRLEHAHRQLQAADPTRGDTVAAVAARWGFAKPDRFAAAYREAFGVLPSHTLRT